MIPRQFVAVLVYALPALVLVFCLLMGGYLLVDAAQDRTGMQVIRWFAVATLMLMAADVLLLAGTLGWIYLERERDPRNDESSDSQTGKG